MVNCWDKGPGWVQRGVLTIISDVCPLCQLTPSLSPHPLRKQRRIGFLRSLQTGCSHMTYIHKCSVDESDSIALRAVVWLATFPSHWNGFYGSTCRDDASISPNPSGNIGAGLLQQPTLDTAWEVNFSCVEQLRFGRPVCMCVCMAVCLGSVGLKNRTLNCCQKSSCWSA